MRSQRHSTGKGTMKENTHLKNERMNKNSYNTDHFMKEKKKRKEKKFSGLQ